MPDRGPAASASLIRARGHGGVTTIFIVVASPSHKHTGRVGCFALNYKVRGTGVESQRASRKKVARMRGTIRRIKCVSLEIQASLFLKP